MSDKNDPLRKLSERNRGLKSERVTKEEILGTDNEGKSPDKKEKGILGKMISGLLGGGEGEEGTSADSEGERDYVAPAPPEAQPEPPREESPSKQQGYQTIDSFFSGVGEGLKRIAQEAADYCRRVSEEKDAEYAARIAGIRRRLEAYHSAGRKLMKSLHEMTGKYNKKEEAFQKQTVYVSELEMKTKKMREQAERIEHIEKQKVDLESKVSSMQGRIRELAESLETSGKSMRLQEEKIDDLKSKVDEAKSYRMRTESELQRYAQMEADYERLKIEHQDLMSGMDHALSGMLAIKKKRSQEKGADKGKDKGYDVTK